MNKYGWTVEFMDGTKRSQFEEGEEILFEEIADKENEISKINVMDWSVDLENCVIKHDNEQFEPDFDKNTKPKLVYKRRNKLFFREDGTRIGEEVRHIMGINDGEVTYAAEVFEDGTYIEPRICDEEALL